MAVKDGLQAIAKIFRYGGYACAAVGIASAAYNLIFWDLTAIGVALAFGAIFAGFFVLVGWVIDKFAL